MVYFPPILLATIAFVILAIINSMPETSSDIVVVLYLGTSILSMVLAVISIIIIILMRRSIGAFDRASAPRSYNKTIGKVTSVRSPSDRIFSIVLVLLVALAVYSNF